MSFLSLPLSPLFLPGASFRHSFSLFFPVYFHYPPRSLLSRPLARSLARMLLVASLRLCIFIRNATTFLSPANTLILFLCTSEARSADAQTRRVLRPDRSTDWTTTPSLKVLRSHSGGVKNSILRDLLPRNKQLRQVSCRSFLRERASSRPRICKRDEENFRVAEIFKASHVLFAVFFTT